jgi:hypothetical protein
VRFMSLTALLCSLALATGAHAQSGGAPLQGPSLLRIEEHTGMVRIVAWMPDGKSILTTSDTSGVRRFDAATGKRIPSEAPNGRGHGAFSRDRTTFAIDDSQAAVCFDAKTGRVHFRTPRQENTLTGLDFSPDGKLLATGTVAFLRIWEVPSGKLLHTVQGHRDLIIRLAFSPDGKTLVTVSWDHMIRAWDPASGQQRYEMPRQPSPMEAVTFSPDGRLLATGCTGGSIRLWNADTGKEVAVLRQRGPIIFGLAFSNDGRFLAASGPNNALEVWELASGRVALSLAGHRAEVMSAAFSPDGKLLASAGQDQAAHIWDWQRPWREAAARGPALTVKEMDNLWQELGTPDPAAGQLAAAALGGAGPKAVALLSQRIGQAKQATAPEVRQWLDELANDRFAVREAATRKLRALGRAAEGPVRERLKAAESTEARRRLSAILAAVEGTGLSGHDLRLVRAVQVLEQAGSPEAVQLLRGLTKAAHGPLLQDEVRRALQRLEAKPSRN